jgi:hypothetical protein
MRAVLDGTGPLAALPEILVAVDPGHQHYVAVLDPHWHPSQAIGFNGAVWPCPVWAVCTTFAFEDARRILRRLSCSPGKAAGHLCKAIAVLQNYEVARR